MKIQFYMFFSISKNTNESINVYIHLRSIPWYFIVQKLETNKYILNES